MTARQTLGQLFRYGLVGLSSNAILYLAYLWLTDAGLGSKLAMSLLYGIGVAQTFFFNKRWSFRHDGAHRDTFVRYCASYAIGYVVNLIALQLLVDQLRLPHQIVQGVMILAIAALLFLLQKFWVFQNNTPRPTAHSTQP